MLYLLGHFSALKNLENKFQLKLFGDDGHFSIFSEMPRSYTVRVSRDRLHYLPTESGVNNRCTSGLTEKT